MARSESNRVIVRRGLNARRARNAFTLWVLLPVHASTAQVDSTDFRNKDMWKHSTAYLTSVSCVPVHAYLHSAVAMFMTTQLQ